MDFMSRLASLMKEGDMTLGRLSKETGISKSSLHGYLQGTEPSLSNLVKLASFFSVSLDFLGTGRELDPIEQLLKVEVHSGVYEVNIKRVVKQGNKE